ncbi:MAG TPA: DNA cytosine methyltransferase [Oscillatoriaceae cyanobacterium M33_DOE_052]|uniref:Cytosine-specific methyltransferase n=1 Tax=Planktothricoides sp. SpSt-374 TaxID=2282167 RepID=A0A7C3VQ85_9CYAN|nr:DNA cytosine methyltransferase [Oscillatoriaceae cyanobacterium M33_DOE_052]
MNRKTRPIGVDLFAGVGGMTLGFELAGFDVLAAVEADPIHCAAHQYNFPFCSVLCADAAQVSGQQIRDNSSIGNQEIDVVFGGPPCQGFSVMGKQALDDPRNQLLWDFVRLVGELKPNFFVMENVKGIIQQKYRHILEIVLDKLDKYGYDVVDNYQVLNAAWYGVPQRRERFFLLGCRRGLPMPKYPAPITYPAGEKISKQISKRGVSGLGADLSALKPTPTVWDALCDLPDLDNYQELLKQDAVEAEFGTPSVYGQKLRLIIRDKDDYGYQRHWDKSLLTCSGLAKHSEVAKERFLKTPPGAIEPVSRFYKLPKDGICNTLRAGTGSDRGSYTAPRPIHPTAPRCITVREGARLHSYPDWFRFHSTKWHGFRQLGNSVPPLMAKAVAAEIFRLGHLALGINPVQPTEIKSLGDPALLSLTTAQAKRRDSGFGSG